MEEQFDPNLGIYADCIRNAMFECLANDSPRLPVADADTIVEHNMDVLYADSDIDVNTNIKNDAISISDNGDYFVFEAATETLTLTSESHSI